MHGYSNGGTKHRAPPTITTGTAATLCLADSQWTVIEIHTHHRRHRPSSIRIRQYHKAEAFQSANMADSDAGDFLYCAGIGKQWDGRPHPLTASDVPKWERIATTGTERERPP